ncbi:TetR/AcrR family transcriptional regulator [Microbispora hainanensis]|uniref:TetR/AcrR family transcriptional regulator n=1 Tax=Microbispora TaxID=2005 RepID=UPI00115A472D|nr:MULTISPECIES: TetR/AcrR family transcriptional regulator [Microbispora]MBX6386903.1 TetR/AcrR family transcriptional regulator [Microbispora sp.]NJP24604.1 TetR/AcrR family transcriptional regulator [Microbispora sp. CL1-1]TQS14731.1 TetR/AcrR family transcriptional regulator [Microbispora sp. SCL1-1]
MPEKAVSTEVREIDQPAYHHGNLRRAVMDAALQAIGESGPAGWSLRELARRAGVSHAAPAHHFGDKAGLLTAVAAEGFELFADALERASGDVYAVGVAYVRFAIDHRPYFEVMFRPDLYRADDPAMRSARERAAHVLHTTAGKLSPSPEQNRLTTIAAWSLAHGFAGLWLNGSLPESAQGDPETIARALLEFVFGPLATSTSQ